MSLKKSMKGKRKRTNSSRKFKKKPWELTGYVKNIVNLLPSKSNLKNYIRPITQFINKIDKINQKFKNMTLFKGIILNLT